jgi:hypothetical protein
MGGALQLEPLAPLTLKHGPSVAKPYMGIKPKDAGLSSVMETHNKAAAIRHAKAAPPSQGEKTSVGGDSYLLSFYKGNEARRKEEADAAHTRLFPYIEPDTWVSEWHKTNTQAIHSAVREQRTRVQPTLWPMGCDVPTQPIQSQSFVPQRQTYSPSHRSSPGLLPAFSTPIGSPQARERRARPQGYAPPSPDAVAGSYMMQHARKAASLIRPRKEVRI